MQRSILTCAFLVLASAAFAQQQTTQPDPYQGQSNPPADDVIVTTQADQPQAKPHPGKPLVQPQAQQQDDSQTQPSADAPPPSSQPASAAANSAPAPVMPPPASVDTAANAPDPDVNGTDDGIVGIARESQPDQTAAASPGLTPRGSLADPDGDMVNPHPLAPGQLADGTTIRVHLLTRLSSVESQQGEVFRTRVASDVLQDGQVLIPTGAEIDGHVVQVAPGTTRSHGTMLLRPDTVILADGTRFHLDAQVTATPGSNAHVNGEGYVNPGSRRKKDSFEYGGAVGGGVVVGALVAGPVGAVTGGLIGAGAVTVRILTDHSQATLEPGTVMLFTLDNRLDLQAAATPANPSGN